VPESPENSAAPAATPAGAADPADSPPAARPTIFAVRDLCSAMADGPDYSILACDLTCPHIGLHYYSLYGLWWRSDGER
jgi:hypothetical protein